MSTFNFPLSSFQADWRLAFASLAILLSVLYTTRKILSYRRLRAFKGPTWASLSQSWAGYQMITGKFDLALIDISTKYGSLARIGPNMLLTDDPAFIRRMSAARSLYTRGAWYDATEIDNQPNTLSQTDEQKHNEMRAKVANGVFILSRHR